MADYNEKVIDLSAVKDKAEIVGPGIPVDSIYINGAIPGGVTSLKIHAGSRVGLELRGFASLELCPPEKGGIYISTVGVAVAPISIIVGTGVFVQGS